MATQNLPPQQEAIAGKAEDRGRVVVRIDEHRRSARHRAPEPPARGATEKPPAGSTPEAEQIAGLFALPELLARVKGHGAAWPDQARLDKACQATLDRYFQGRLYKESMTHPTFPDRLRDTRKRQGLTQAELASRVGVTVQAISQWEKGQSGASHQRIELLGQVLGVDWDWLGYGAEVTDPHKPHSIVSENVTEYQKGPLCIRQEIAWWVQENPSLDKDVADVLDFEKREHVRGMIYEWFEPRLPPTGIVFATAIISKSMEPMFYPGDLILCDTGLSPIPGDHVLAYLPKTKRVVFRRLRYRNTESGKTIAELFPTNPDFPSILLASEDSGRIIATMTEHRRYRGLPSDELGLHLDRRRIKKSSST